MADITSAIRNGDIAAIKSYIDDLEECDNLKQAEMLKNAQSSEVASVIRKAFEARMSDPRAQGADKEQKKDTSSVFTEQDSEEELSEREALQKYSKRNPKVEKAALIFLSAFKASIKGIKWSKAVFLSFEIAEYIFQNKADMFPKVVRSKSHNLKENSKLCNRVYKGHLPAAEFVEMSVSDMKSDELRSIDAEAMRDSLLASQVAKAASETDMFQCSRCKERKCTYSQLQTRSCDEPMTTFVHCTVCGHRWRF